MIVEYYLFLFRSWYLLQVHIQGIHSHLSSSDPALLLCESDGTLSAYENGKQHVLSD